VDAFLDRYYQRVYEHLNDPSLTRRVTKAKLLRDLREVETMVYERLMGITGQESMVGRCEVIVPVVNGVSHYNLPGNFRQFIAFERRNGSTATDTGDRNFIVNTLDSRNEYEAQSGVQILSGMRGMMIRPEPQLSATEYWTLVYLKGPLELHNATAGTVADPQENATVAAAGYAVSTVGTNNLLTYADTFTHHMVGETVSFASPVNATATVAGASRTITAADSDSITFALVVGLADDDTFSFDTDWSWVASGTVPDGGGELIATADYYNGSILRIYSATTGEFQEKEIIDFSLDSGDAKYHFKCRHHWTEVPTGDIKYEICPALPQNKDGLYAMDAAMLNLGQRAQQRRYAMLRDMRKEMWSACSRWVVSNVADRAPALLEKPNMNEPDPYD